MQSLGSGYRALVIGASGGIGSAVVDVLRADADCGGVACLSRASHPGFDLADAGSIRAAAADLSGEGPFSLIFDATGALEIDGHGPEKSLRAVDADVMARQFAVNAIGPALLLQQFLPHLARDRRALVATLSARVGSIGDNRLGGWISYRASKAALNQIVRTVAVEVARTHPQAVIAALHPGTVATSLSDRFAGSRERFSPQQSAGLLLSVLDGLQPVSSGGFFAYDGSVIDW